MHLHLDPVGGAAGDMFVAAVLDAFPDLASPMLDALGKSGLPNDVTCRVVDHTDGILTGHRFNVTKASQASHSHINPAASSHLQSHGHLHSHGHAHHEHSHDQIVVSSHNAHGADHMPFKRVKLQLGNSLLEPDVRDHAIGIFQLLAQAEAQVHGMSIDDVVFHEVGAWDSIADIVAAAYVISSLGKVEWSCGPLPLGSGRFKSAHGLLSVPAPATVELLTGFVVFDDGLPGERVTPTGAAILKYLNCAPSLGSTFRQLSGSGVGFGQRRLPGMSNVLRVLVFENLQPEPAAAVVQLSFEVDDQTGEDLAVGLERIRAMPGVLDVIQIPAFGKKGRMMAKIQVLARPEVSDQVCHACFSETSTLGVRHQVLPRIALDRNETQIPFDSGDLRVKTTRRPNGTITAKAEMDDLVSTGADRAGRDMLRRAAESRALEGAPDDD